MTIAEAFVEEGRQEGLEKGLEKGLKEGRQEGRQEERQTFRFLLIKQLNLRFPHKVTQEHLHAIEEAGTDKLSYWIEKLMTSTTIEEVFSCF